MIGTRPVVMLLSEGQMSDYKGARLIVNDLPLAKHLLADRGYDADWSGKQRHQALHPAQEEPENTDRIRQNSLQAASQGREHVRQTQRLAPRCNTI